MQIDSYKSQEVRSLGPHPDYERNLSKAVEFIKNIQKSILPGMSVKLSNPLPTEDGALKNSILAIAWKTPYDAYQGNCCYPVSLHQDFGKFCLELEHRYSEYHKAVKEYWESKNVTVLSEPLPEIASKTVSLAPAELMWWDR